MSSAPLMDRQRFTCTRQQMRHARMRGCTQWAHRLDMQRFTCTWHQMRHARTTGSMQVCSQTGVYVPNTQGRRKGICLSSFVQFDLSQSLCATPQ